MGSSSFSLAINERTGSQAGSAREVQFWRGYRRCPQATFNAAVVATLAGLQAGKEKQTTFAENRKTASGDVLALG